MKRTLYVLCAVVVGVCVALMAGCSSRERIVGPSTDTTPEGEYRYVSLTPEVTLALHRSIPDSVRVTIGVADSLENRGSFQATATWLDGWRVGYGWDYDRDFYIDYKTPRSCCYRVYMTYALYYALQLAGKPLVVYGLSCNADGTITWRIVIGASAIQFLSPASDWFLKWQAKMQYLG